MNLESGLISVIMSNYNTPEEYLRESIESILNQTYSNFEFIIVDDCSTDNSLNVIKSYKDNRIIVIENTKNLGLTKSLNKALKQAKGEFVARMDADDISLPTRFEKQVAFLKENPNVIVCGTWCENFGDKTNIVRLGIPDRETYHIYQLFSNYPGIRHPSAMFNNILLSKYNIEYNENYIYAQDYRMWVNCSACSDCAIVPEVLLKYRIHSNAISSAKVEIQEECAKMVMQEQLDKLGLKLPDNWRTIHNDFFLGRKQYLLEQRDWIKSILSANKNRKVYDQSLLEDLLWKKWAETTYFELYRVRGLNKLPILFNLPIRHWTELFKIKNNRKRRCME